MQTSSWQNLPYTKAIRFNQATRDMFTKLPVAQDYCRTEYSPSDGKIYGLYPSRSGDWIYSDTTEQQVRTIRELTVTDGNRLKTILAHLCKQAKKIAAVDEKLTLAQRSIEQINALPKEEESTKTLLLTSTQLILNDYEPRKDEIHNAIFVLLALLIKESYNFDHPSRECIFRFLDLANLTPLLNTIQSKASSRERSFRDVYFSDKPASSSDLLAKFLDINKKGMMAAVFAFCSENLKPKSLPSELEAPWPIKFVNATIV